MTFPGKAAPPSQTEGELLDGLRRRLELAFELTLAVREHLRRGDAESIEAASSRLETVAQEFKVLAEEYARVRADRARDRREGEDPGLEAGRRRFAETVRRLTRQSALTGGLLERLVILSKGLAGVLASTTAEGGYLPSGRTAEPPRSSGRLGELA